MEYEEAIKKEDNRMTLAEGDNIADCDFMNVVYFPFPITIGRVMQALPDIHFIFSRHNDCVVLNKYVEGDGFLRWRHKKDGQECTDEDQSDECISKLLELLQPN